MGKDVLLLGPNGRPYRAGLNDVAQKPSESKKKLPSLAPRSPTLLITELSDRDIAAHEIKSESIKNPTPEALRRTLKKAEEAKQRQTQYQQSLREASLGIKEATTKDFENYDTSRTKEKDLVEKFASEFSITPSALIHILNEDPSYFIDSYATKYLNSQVNNAVVPTYNGVIKGIMEIYKLTQACSNQKSNAKLMTLNYIFFLLKFIKFAKKKENLFSDEFLTFLIDEYKQEHNKDCKGFLEQFLTAFSKRISKESAKELLKKLNTEFSLASNFAQTLFIRHPELKNDFKNIDPSFKEMTIDAIIEQRDRLALLVQNSTNLLSQSGRKGKLGFEIEVRLLKEPGYKSFESLNISVI